MATADDTTRPDGTPEDENPSEQGPEDEPFAEDEGRENITEVSQDPELELGDEDARLPWLENDDEEEQYEGYNTGHLVGLVLLGLLALGVIGGGIWWATQSGRDETLVANGETIEAPDAPYKKRPENPGGKVFEGTGDSSFAVSEGDSRQARLERQDTSGQGSVTPDGDKPRETSDKRVKQQVSGETAESARSNAPGVQIGAYSNREQAEAGWRQLSSQYDVLGGMKYRIVEGQADIGKVFRLQALPGDRSAARSLCSRLQASGLNCYVKD